MICGDRQNAPLPDREQFDLPANLAYLDAAACGPLSRETREAGVRALGRRARPWSFDRAAAAADIERARERAAELIGADADDLAVVTSVSHAAAIAAGNVPLRAGVRVVRLEGEHPSNALPWARLVARGAVEDVVSRPADSDWTRAVLETIERPGAASLGVVTLAPYHWTDGARLDLERLVPVIRRAGGLLFVDATHVAGIEPIDVVRHRPDFLAFPLFKWLLGPHGIAFLYADPSHQQGEPVDRSANNSRLDADLGWAGFAAGARRYDRGQRDDPLIGALAAAALEQASAWGTERVAARVSELARALAAAASGAGASILPNDQRAPHIVGLRFDDAGRASRVAAQLAANGVTVSERRGVVRLSPHVYNDESDVEHFAAALPDALRA